jgi:hypothetical protein
MKAELTFTLPEERKAFQAAAKADDMAIILWEIVFNLCRDINREFDGNPEVEQVIDAVFSRINELIEKHGIIIDDLTE